ncbi:hypothetical protein G9A89_006634 [Geosiphon pyriformis]|nr:hypothetical protein G9A89_006634 [Geosiphon pyriformis]
MDQNQENQYQQLRYQQNIVLQYSIPQNQLPQYAQQTIIKDGGISTTIRCKPTVDHLDQFFAVLSNLDQHQLDTQIKLSILDFDKFTPVEGKNVKQIFQSSKQTKSNIPPATITENTTLAAIFFFDINNLNTHSLFSETAIN